MTYWLVSFIAGFLTVIAPCSLFLLPTILVGSATDRNPARPWIVVGSMGLSVFLFSLIIKVTSLAFVIPEQVWIWISGGLLTLFGFSLLFPEGWEMLATRLSLEKSKKWLETSKEKKGTGGAILLGASLGPVFSTCSPTFGVLLAVILPTSFFDGVLNVALFILGMMIPFLLIAIGGQRVVRRLRFAANPRGWFRRTLGFFLILAGVVIFTGFQKTVEQALIKRGYLGAVKFEQRLLDNEESPPIDLSVQNKFKRFSTDLSQHAISFDAILSGGPGKDGIPALNEPAFIPLADAKLRGDDLGIFLEIEGDQRYYPFAIMVWHEIVNDMVGGEPVAVTFCPLCGSAIVFSRTVGADVLDFGVSGFLYESNLLMYDRQTESFWSQVLGEGVVGAHTGTKLDHLEMQRLPFSEVKEKYPEAKVLSDQTGHVRNYKSNPYGGYDESEAVYFPVTIQDQRFFSKEMMLVVPVEKTWVAFPWNALREQGNATIDVNGQALTVTLEGSEASVDYGGKVLPTYFEMWFSFATHHSSDSLIWTP